MNFNKPSDVEDMCEDVFRRYKVQKTNEFTKKEKFLNSKDNKSEDEN